MSRRYFLWAWLCAAGSLVLAYRSASAAPQDADEDSALLKRRFGRMPVLSSRVRLNMPPVFANGYGVPLNLSVETPMTQADHVTSVHIIAPQNPIVLAASFNFTPLSGQAAVQTRIRLARSQGVLAVAEMNDGGLLMSRCQVKVDVNGCA
jgi:sulfur-oxidizing protein SoxY